LVYHIEGSATRERLVGTSETLCYEFTVRQSGTNMYHSHFDEMTQQALGLVGMFVIRRKRFAA